MIAIIPGREIGQPRKFLDERKLVAEAVATPAFFDALVEAMRNPEGVGFSWCNDTKYPAMASLGFAEMGSIITRGWYRVESGQCVRPDLRGDPRRVYSYAETVDGSGRTVKRGDAALSWGSARTLHARWLL